MSLERTEHLVPAPACILILALGSFALFGPVAAAQEQQGQQEQAQQPEQKKDKPPPQQPELRHFEPFPSRWLGPGRGIGAVQVPEYDEVNEPADPLNPYRQNVLKGDYPILGTEDLFLSLTFTERLIYQFRNLPTPTGISGCICLYQ